MENIVFTQLSIPELRKLFRQELEQFHEVHATKQAAYQDNVPGQAAPTHVSKREAARLLGCSQGTVDNFARAGKLKRSYLGKSVRFDRAQVLGLTRSHTNSKQ